MGHEVSFDHHRFDPQTGRLWAGRREVGLTPRAAAVLAVLVARAGELVTRHDLFQSVWGDTIVSDAALTACIQELRGALGDDARRPRFIETRHRRGYRFAARVLPAPAHPSRTPAPAPPGPATVVVGRDAELGDLRACLERAVSGHRQIVFVTGEPGIGKTTLIAQFLAEAAGGERPRIAQGRCIETHGAGEAYLPLLEAMTRLCREPGGQSITRLLRHHAPTWLAQMPSVLSAPERRTLERQSSGITRERMLRELAEAVEVMAAEVPLVLWLEDLHWSDPPTVDWLAYLARRPGPARILVLASCRPVEAPGHPLEPVKDELTLHGHCRELALTRLDATAIGEYLTRRFPADHAFGALAGMIHARTGGNPLFVVNVADDLVRRAVLVEHAGRWEVEELPGPAQIAIPEDVRRMIGRQLDRLRPDERLILEAASAAGVEFSAAAVAAGEQIGLDDVERACADLAERATFLIAHGDETWPDGTVAGRYGFRHALYQEVVYETTPAARRVDLNRRIGERLEAGLRERAVERATELAMHFERGRDGRRVVHYLRLAGEVATRRSAAREAVAHLTRALDLLRAQPDTPERAEQEVALQIALGGPLMAMKGRGAPEVEQAYTRAQELCQKIGDTPQLFPVVWGLFLFHRSRGEIDRAHGFATRLLALARPTGDPDLLIEAHHSLWATLFARGELAAAADHAAQALALYSRERHAPLAAVYGNHDPAVCALGHGAWALELAGEPEQASRRSAEAAALARRLGHPFSEAHALLYAARLHQFRGDWQATGDRSEAAAALARAGGFVQLQAWAHVTGGWALAESGNVAGGLARMRDGIAAIRALGSEEFKTYFLGLLAATLAKAGEHSAALEVVTEALGAVERSGERFYAAELHRQRGELLLATGHDRADAIRCFESALEIARHQRARALERRARRALDSAAGSVAAAREPSFTAMWHAWLRYTHATAHLAPIYSDTRSVQLVPEPALARVRSAMAGLSREAATAFILMTVTRCRVFADRLLPAHERGVRQLVILGAGLDVTGFGLPAWADQWRTFEVDTPATQTWKRQQIAATGWDVPPNLIFAPCDFERQGLLSALAAAGFDTRMPAMVSLFGVILYLSADATKQTLAELATLAPGSELTFSYCSPADQADPVVQELMSKSTPVVDATGESFVGYYRVSEMESLVRAAGFRGALYYPIEELNARYFPARPDGLRLRPIERLLTALC